VDVVGIVEVNVMDVSVNADMEADADSPPPLVDVTVDTNSNTESTSAPTGQLQSLPSKVQDMQLMRVPITIVTGIVMPEPSWRSYS